MTTSLLFAAWYTEFDVWFSLFKAMMGVGFVIFVHELGHFLVAKACGVKCEKFYVGFDPPIKIGPIQLPRTLMKFQWGETEYGIGIIPLGGYVKMLGQDDNPGNAAAEAERSKAADSTTGENSSAAEVTSPEKVEWDPRSYPAKNVPQRMAIISAGVTMNAITAVLFAALAFKMGVSFMPAQVGAPVPGDPAWVAGIQPGDQILQIGKSGEPSEYLRFGQDLREKTFLNGFEDPLHLLVRSVGETESHWVEIQPRERKNPKGRSYPSLGVQNLPSLKLGDDLNSDIPAESILIRAEIAATGENPGQSVDLENHWEFSAFLAQHLDEPILCTFQVTDEDGLVSEKKVTLPPTPMATLGIELEMGPIVGLLPGSPADRAGLLVNDIIREIDGAPAGDPLLLNDRLLRKVGSSVELLVQRGEERVTLTIEPELPNTYLGRHAQPDTPLAAITIGAVFETSSTIAAIAPDSPAADSNLQVGDDLTEVLFQVPEGDEEIAEKVSDALRQMADTPFQLDEGEQHWGFINGGLQTFPEETLLEIHYQRGKKEESTTLSAMPSDQWHAPHRGLVFQALKVPHVAESTGEAMRLGLRQAREDGTKIFAILSRLFTGKVKLTDLGGLPTIVVVATMEAKEGFSRLLLFLTMLSINLAILNMLPIPVLDGGHMLFLIYEGIARKPVNETVAYRLSVAGLSFLLLLMLFVTGKDIILWIGVALQG